MIEIYDFDCSLKTKDLLREFKKYARNEFRIKWVDDTHAIGIFASAKQGEERVEVKREGHEGVSLTLSLSLSLSVCLSSFSLSLSLSHTPSLPL